MSRADRLAWAATESLFTGAPVSLPDGSTVELVPVKNVLTNREHAESVARKHGIPGPDSLVPVQVLPCGLVRNHWDLMSKGDAAKPEATSD